METLFIPAEAKAEVNYSKIEKISKKLPKSISVVYSIQYKKIAEEIKKILSEKHKITKFTQVLGCSKPKFPKQTKAILLIGSGKFHALSLASEISLPIYILERDKFYKISEKDIDSYKKNKKASYLNFLNSEEAGILVSIKPGQQNLQKALSLKKNLKDKKCYLFLGNNINSEEFENFSIKSWINTACPRLDMDIRIINVSDLNLGN